MKLPERVFMEESAGKKVESQKNIECRRRIWSKRRKELKKLLRRWNGEQKSKLRKSLTDDATIT